MADDGFTPQVEWILRHVTGPHQTMLFSATLDGDVAHLVRRYLNNPVEVSVDNPTDTVGTMRHLFLGVHHMDKARVVASLSRARVEDGRVLRHQAGLRQGGHRARKSSESTPLRSTAICRRPLARRRCGGSPTASCPCWSPPMSPPAASTSTTSGSSCTTSRRWTPRPTCTAPGAPLAPDATAGPSTLAEYNQHTTCRIVQRALRMDVHDPIEVFSNDRRLAQPRGVRRPRPVGRRRRAAEQRRRPILASPNPFRSAIRRETDPMRTAGVAPCLDQRQRRSGGGGVLHRSAGPAAAHRPPGLRHRRGVARRRRPAGAPDRGADARPEGPALRVPGGRHRRRCGRASAPSASTSAIRRRSASTASASCTTRAGTWSS